MSKVFLKGFVFLIPILGVLLIISKLVKFIVSVLNPFFEKLGIKNLMGESILVVVAILVVVLLIFFLGWLTRFTFALKAQNYLENTIFLIFPPLSFLKMNTLSMFSKSGNSCILFKDGESWIVAFVIEEDDNWMSIYIPGIPNPNSGELKIIKKEESEIILINPKKYNTILKNYGKGMLDELKQNKASDTNK